MINSGTTEVTAVIAADKFINALLDGELTK